MLVKIDNNLKITLKKAASIFFLLIDLELVFMMIVLHLRMHMQKENICRPWP